MSARIRKILAGGLMALTTATGIGVMAAPAGATVAPATFNIVYCNPNNLNVAVWNASTRSYGYSYYRLSGAALNTYGRSIGSGIYAGGQTGVCNT
jgi:hypothetical protein